MLKTKTASLIFLLICMMSRIISLQHGNALTMKNENYLRNLDDEGVEKYMFDTKTELGLRRLL